MSKQEIILNTEDDWDLWIEKIEAITDKNIWPHIEPSNDDIPSDVADLLEMLV